MEPRAPLARLPETVYVLDAFEKRTRRAVKNDPDLARQRLLLKQRARRKG
jgi:phage-related protein